MEIGCDLKMDDQVLEQFCQRHRIRRLALFGSSLEADLRSDSDVDVLVDFRPGSHPGLLRLAQMELELEALLRAGEVEMRTYEDLIRHFRDTVRQQATILYDSA